MIELENFSLIGLMLFLILLPVIYYYCERLSHNFLNTLKLKDENMKLLTRKIIMTLFGLGVFLLVNLELRGIFSLLNFKIGLIWMGVGVGFALLVAIITFQMVTQTDYGEKYMLFLNQSPILTLITLGIFVGPAEDILFLGVIQNALVARIGWLAIVFYIVVFAFFHYINVLSNAESKKEFLGMLPVRLMISLIMAVAYYQTNSLIYSLIIHNLFDTINYLVLFKVAKNKIKLKQ